MFQSVALAVAMNMNRVLVMDRNNVTGVTRKESKNSFQVNNTFCISQQKEDLVIKSFHGLNNPLVLIHC